MKHLDTKILEFESLGRPNTGLKMSRRLYGWIFAEMCHRYSVTVAQLENPSRQDKISVDSDPV